MIGLQAAPRLGPKNNVYLFHFLLASYSFNLISQVRWLLMFQFILLQLFINKAIIMTWHRLSRTTLLYDYLLGDKNKELGKNLHCRGGSTI